MRLITNPDPYNGGKAEVLLLNSLIKKLHEYLGENHKAAWIVASGVQSEMYITIQILEGRKKPKSILVLPVIHSTVLRLREVSIGAQGQPWFRFSLVIDDSGKPNVSYDWLEDPRVHEVDLLLDLVEFPRERCTLPEWYFR